MEDKDGRLGEVLSTAPVGLQPGLLQFELTFDLRHDPADGRFTLVDVGSDYGASGDGMVNGGNSRPSARVQFSRAADAVAKASARDVGVATGG